MREKPAEQEASAERMSVRKLLSSLPSPYGERYRALLRLRNMFHEEMAEALRSSLNEWVRQRPQQTAIERDRMAGTLNHDLRMLGLAFKCPRTERPAWLALSAREGDPAAGTRYHFELCDHGPGARSPEYDDLPELEPISNPPQVQRLRSSLQGQIRRRREPPAR